MSYIDYNTAENSISLIKVPKRLENDYQLVDADENFQTIEKDGQFIGLKLFDFLSNMELQGRIGEDAFKELLDKNRIPYLYIGQGPVGIEYSETLKNVVQSKRPDFLINIPDIGILFIDVKCYRRIGFPKDKNSYFQIFIKEIQSLVNLHKQLLVPVWVAFYDMESAKNEPHFYLVSISSLKRYADEILRKLDKRECSLLSSLRIPNELLHNINETIFFRAGLTEIEDEMIESFSNKHSGLIRRIEDEIKLLIRTGEVSKSKVGEQVLNIIGQDLCFKIEIDLILGNLINEGVVIYNKKKPLKLLGE